MKNKTKFKTNSGKTIYIGDTGVYDEKYGASVNQTTEIETGDKLWVIDSLMSGLLVEDKTGKQHYIEPIQFSKI